MTSEAFVLLWVSFLGTLFWPVNPDAAVVYYVTGRGRPPLEAAALALAGQAVMLLILYFAGEKLRQRWHWLNRKCEVVEARWGDRLSRSTIPVAALSGFVGVPPSVATMLLAAALQLPARKFLPVFFICRAGWFLALSYVGNAFT